MTALVVPAAAGSPTGPLTDRVADCLEGIVLASGRLVVATINGHDKTVLRAAVSDAVVANAAALALRDAIAHALAPATEEEVREEGLRLLRAWPQDRRGDLAGFGAELRIFLHERRPGRRALQQACRTLKLTQVHLPAIAEVMAAIDQAEGALHHRARLAAELPARIARAEAALAPKPPRSGTEPRPMRAAS